MASFRVGSRQRPSPSVIHVVRAQNGGSQSRLVLCDDGKLYVMKMHPNPQGPNVLANEALGAILLSGLGLTVPLWRPLTINLQTLPLFPELAMEARDKITFPACGVHFGSEFLGGSEVNLFDFIPESYQRKVTNAEQFAAIRLFDMWANHQDQRQCVYRRTKETGVYEAFFLDNGHLFGGPGWLMDARHHRSKWLAHAPQAKSGRKRRERSLALFERVIPTLLREAIALVPSEWYEDDINDLYIRLLRRLGTLRALDEDLEETGSGLLGA